MKTYDTYKDSGIEWLGQIPEHWENYRIDELANIVRGNTSFKRDELLENGDYVALQYGRVYNVDEVNSTYNFYINDDFYKSDQIVKFSDTILISTSETIEDLRHSCFYNRKDLGLLGGEQILLSPYSNRIIGKYLYYYSRFFCRELRKYATGIKVYRYNIFDLKQIKLPIPSIPEQSAIVHYLDTKTQAIDQKVQLLERKIGYYKELRQSIINEAVTKGLDRNVKLKDSGINWIGQIPEHWEVKRFKDIVLKYTTGGTPPTSNNQYFDGDNIWVCIGDLDTSKFIGDSKIKLTDDAILDSNIVKTPKGSLLYSFKLSIGKMAFANRDLYTNEAIVSIFPNRHIDLNFFYFMLPIFMDLASTENIYGAKILNQKLIANALLVQPPLKEQTAIAQYLDQKTQTIDRITANIQKQIATLKELRKTLINEVVTGKQRVYEPIENTVV